MPSYSETNLINWYNNGILVPERLILLDNDPRDADDNDVSWEKATRFIKNISILEASNPSLPILIMSTDCDGGSETAGYAIYDRIRECPCHVTIRSYGSCMSMMTVILQAADDRQLSPNSHFMIHDGQDEMSGHVRNIKSWADWSQVQLKKMYDIYYDVMKEKNPKITRKKIEELCKFDSVMTAERAVELGLADSVYTGKSNA